MLSRSVAADLTALKELRQPTVMRSLPLSPPPPIPFIAQHPGELYITPVAYHPGTFVQHPPLAPPSPPYFFPYRRFAPHGQSAASGWQSGVPQGHWAPMPHVPAFAWPKHADEPQSVAQEQEQLQRALKLSLEEYNSRSFLDEVQQSAQETDDAITPFQELPPEIQEVYGDALEYEAEVTASKSTSTNIGQLLEKHSMHIVENDGKTACGENNCLLISMLQHATGDYQSNHDFHVDYYRSVLESLPQHAVMPNEKISAASVAARTLVELINENSSLQHKLDVVVVSQVGKQLFSDRISSGAPNARTVFIVDHGGHFEAINHG
jgi:hypothetical protein